MTFVEKLVELTAELDIESNVLPYAFAIEHLNAKGYMDYVYFTRKYKVYGSVSDFRKAVLQVLGTDLFTYEEPTEYVTEEEFFEHYEFGKFPNVAWWIPYLAKATGKAVRKQELFTWVVSTSTKSTARPNYVTDSYN